MRQAVRCVRPTSNAGSGATTLLRFGALRSVADRGRASRSFFQAASKGVKGAPVEWEQVYQKKTPIEHVLLRPDTYVGSVEENVHSRWTLAPGEQAIRLREVEYVPALYKLFDEVLVNACDNFLRPSSGQTRIDVKVDARKGTISVFNDGRTIPVVIHKQENVYMPELVFGHLLTGSNFDDSVAKATGGRNGYGAKLANIFSKSFVVEIWDPDRGVHYKQTWSDNMTVVGAPEISPLGPKEKSGTRVTFAPDLKRFSCKKQALSAEGDLLQVFRTRCFDVAACSEGLTVTFNGETMPSSFEEYFRLFDLHTMGSVFAKMGRGWQVGVGVVEASSSSGSHVSFVNSINTLRGGTHVNHILDQICKGVAAAMKKDTSLPVVQPAYIKAHLVVFVNSQVPNPTFDSQTKETLTTSMDVIKELCTVPADFIQKIVSETPLIEVVTRYARMREDNKIKVKKGARLHGIPKLEDANKAGTKDGHLCTLIVTEGDSAKALAVAGLSVVGRDHYGVYPLRGKFLNVRDATDKKMSENKEILELKRILGLQSEADYSQLEARASLRYGRVMLMTDQDADGSHIKGLFINFIHVLWPSLVTHNGFLMEFVTPLIKATKGKQAKWFFSLSEYKAWTDDRAGWRVKYYKGLGTSSSAEAREYFSDLDRHVKQFEWSSKEDDSTIELAFSKLDGTASSDKRKRWLEHYDPEVFVDRAVSNRKLSYSDFVNKELVAYMYYSNLRAIPSLFDGLKLGQRKVLYSCFKKGLRVGDEIKVVQLAGYVSEVAAYHHGETALHGTIVNMAASYVGSNNNVPLLEGVGQFGTRLQGGKDAASPRYIYCGIGALTRDLFREEDEELLTEEEEDGERVQPKHYMPIIPTILINGQEGVGTGWSSSVPPFDPIQVVDNMINKLDDKPLKPMIPWFRGYK